MKVSVLAPEHTEIYTAPTPLLKPAPSSVGAVRFELAGARMPRASKQPHEFVAADIEVSAAVHPRDLPDDDPRKVQWCAAIAESKRGVAHQVPHGP